MFDFFWFFVYQLSRRKKGIPPRRRGPLWEHPFCVFSHLVSSSRAERGWGIRHRSGICWSLGFGIRRYHTEWRTHSTAFQISGQWYSILVRRQGQQPRCWFPFCWRRPHDRWRGNLSWRWIEFYNCRPHQGRS